MTMTMSKDEFFRQPLYMLHVTGWPAEAVRPRALAASPNCQPENV